MPRHARIKSSTGIYHVMIRGINKEQIFKKDIYKGKALKTIKEIKDEIEFSIIAYCVMDNHIHLLMKAEEDVLTEVMRKLDVKYAMYYNHFEERYGYVFQDRFKSEAIEDKNYLLCALRYIHNNPVKSMMAESITKYPWSSANDYVYENTGIVSEKYLHWILNLFKNKEDFIKFHDLFDDKLYIDTKEEQNKNIQEIINQIIEKYVKEKGIVDKTQISQEHKEELATRVLKYDYISQIQIADIFNLSQYKVSVIKNTITNK